MKEVALGTPSDRLLVPSGARKYKVPPNNFSGSKAISLPVGRVGEGTRHGVLA